MVGLAPIGLSDCTVDEYRRALIRVPLSSLTLTFGNAKTVTLENYQSRTGDLKLSSFRSPVGKTRYSDWDDDGYSYNHLDDMHSIQHPTRRRGLIHAIRLKVFDGLLVE